MTLAFLRAFRRNHLMRTPSPARGKSLNARRRAAFLESLEDRRLLAVTWEPLKPLGSLMFHSDNAGQIGAPVAIFADDFESGALGPQWTTSSSTANGRVVVSNVLGAPPNSGSFHLAMDTTVNGPNNRNEALLSVDLSGATDASLSFAHKDVGDEDQSLPATFVGSFDGDGVSISAGGGTWHRLVSLSDANSPNGTYTKFSFDLEAAAAAAGISLGANFQVKFQQYDNFAFNSDGRVFDDVAITVPGPLTETTTAFLEGGQRLTVVAAPKKASVTLTATVRDPANGVLASVTAAGPGETVEIQTIGIAGDGDYTVKISGDAPTEYNLSLYRNATVEVTDTGDGSEQDATGSWIPLGSGRFGILGSFEGVPVEPPPPTRPIYTTHNDGRSLGTISTASGIGSDVGPFGFGQTWAAAFDTNGALYTLVNGFSGNARLATVNRRLAPPHPSETDSAST